MGVHIRTFSGEGMLERPDGTIIGGKRHYEITVTPEYIELGGGEKVESTQKIEGYLALVSPEEAAALGGDLVLQLEDRRRLPFYFSNFATDRGWIVARGSLA